MKIDDIRSEPASPQSVGTREREVAFAVAMRYLKDTHDAEDAAQDALLLAYRHRASFRGRSKFGTWFYRVAVTTALMHLRSRRRREARVQVDELYACEAAPAPELDPEARAIVAADIAQVARRVGEMSATSRRALCMSVAEGYTCSEIGRTLGIPVGTAKTQIHRARATLRAA